MSGQVIFETNVIDRNDFSASTADSDVRITHPKLSDAFRSVITHEEVEDLVRKAVSPDAELVNHYLRSYSEEKIGFLGSHLCLTVVYRRFGCHENEIQSFFVKTLPFDVPTQVSYIQELGFFRKESEFFGLLVPLLMDNFKGDSWAPKCYLAKENLLIFEDLKMSGFSNRSKIFDEKSIRAALACVARFHASSLLAEERIEGKSMKNAFPALLEDTQHKRTGSSYTWYSVAMDLAVALADELGLDSTTIKKASERLFDISEPSKTKRNVVSHGDIWSSNMVFDGINRCYLVDFQLVRYSPLAHDVMQLLYLCSSREFRQKHERKMIEYYYQILTETLKTNNFKGDLISFEEVLQGAEEQRFAAAVTAMIFHPTVLMDGKTAATIMNDTVTYESYFFKDRRPFVDKIMANDPEYRIKIIEDVKELVELSTIVDSLPRPT